RVVLLERETFPRFQIGESLLPFNNDLFDQLGLSETLQRGGFVRKFGAEFVTGDALRSHRFRFDANLPSRYGQSLQVRRAEFDQILLENARRAGTAVNEGWRVVDVDLSDPDRVVVTAIGPDGERKTIETRMVIDASGHAGVIASREERIEREDRKKIAVFAHYRNVAPSAEGDEAGNIVITILKNGWLWLIPLSDELTSVGLVVDSAEFRASGLTPETLLEETIRMTPYTHARMSAAERVTAVRARKDYSYRMDRLIGPNHALVGDAAGFIDPIFSTGVFLAMKSAELAAVGIERRLSTGSLRLLKRYERSMQRVLERYTRIIDSFYQREFLEVFLNPQKNLALVPVVIGLLAGNAFASSSNRWRMHLFYLLVTIQRWAGVVAPPIPWENLPEAACAPASEVRVG
ncbi:MAG TPA: NAD(P)/FAD-dependent oxidoreductase, partial [Thermoanaerobaculia bacterium]|nr:NAD(P)/FAD-dependent oxidoreductase [Thermoanaerobaculia bacterium]